MAGHTFAAHIGGYGSTVYPPIHATANFTKTFDIAAARRPEFSISLPSLRVTKPNVIDYLTGNGVDFRLQLDFCLSFLLVVLLALTIMVGVMHSSGFQDIG